MQGCKDPGKMYFKWENVQQLEVSNFPLDLMSVLTQIQNYQDYIGKYTVLLGFEDKLLKVYRNNLYSNYTFCILGICVEQQKTKK